MVNICCVCDNPLSCSMAISLTPDFELSFSLSLSWMMAVMCCLFCFHHSYLTDSWVQEFELFLSLQAWMMDILDCKSWKREAHTIEVSLIICTCMYMYMHMYSEYLSILSTWEIFKISDFISKLTGRSKSTYVKQCILNPILVRLRLELPWLVPEL